MRKVLYEQEVLNQAVEALQVETGLRLIIKEREARKGDTQIDAVAYLPDAKKQFAIEVKKWVAQANLGALIHQLENLPMKALLAADYVNPVMARKFKEKNIQFIDTAGNAFINAPPIYIYVTNNKPTDTKQVKEKAQRAFNATGLKVIYAFLCDPALVNATYREIADTADTALGTVGWVINDLKDNGFLIERGAKGRKLTNHKKLLERWVEQYPNKLRNKLHIGNYIAEHPWWWKDVDINGCGGYWGGEVAAEKYTNHYLKPKIATVYIEPENIGQLIKRGRLRKAEAWHHDDAGLVKLYKPFWQNLKNTNTEIVPPLLAYAELVATDDPRNLDAAKIIYEKYLDKLVREN